VASLYDIKPQFQNLLRPLCRLLYKKGISANQVTWLALLMSVALGATLYWQACAPWTLALLPPFLLLRMMLNALDGMLAREFHMQSKQGAILNEMGDVLSDVALYLPLWIIAGPLVVWCVCAALITEFAGVCALLVGAPRRYDGPMGKSDRAFVFGLLALLLALDVTPEPWLDGALWGVIGLSLFTAYKRCINALKAPSTGE
jgi:CDP-diacylglycerol--glycerol-3-phosphate 3-phosphatidyltransferase